MKSTLVAVCLLLAPLGGAAGAPAVETKVLTWQGARSAIDAAVDEARQKQATGAFAVVDAGGNLIALERLDGTFPAAARVAMDKARTAALFRKPTRDFESIIRGGRTPMIALDDFTPLQGGVPIVVGDEVVGAIGVSGAASAQQDDDFAVIGANAVAESSLEVMEAAPEVTYIRSADVTAAFAKGAPLVENRAFKVHASRRERPGEAEVHTDETDIIYVLEGSATFVTGGAVVEGKETAPREIRGRSIEGGEARTLVRGDVVIVPGGTPHWFKSVSGPFLYYVVKVH